MYVTLEPCAHEGRQPPCVEAILEAGISRVVIGSDDPSEKASGRARDPSRRRRRGRARERRGGDRGAPAQPAFPQARPHRTAAGDPEAGDVARRPDGDRPTAPPPGSPASESRALVHRWRAESDAIAVGIDTVLADDPLLTARPTPSSAPFPLWQAKNTPERMRANRFGSSSTAAPGCRSTRSCCARSINSPVLVVVSPKPTSPASPPCATRAPRPCRRRHRGGACRARPPRPHEPLPGGRPDPRRRLSRRRRDRRNPHLRRPGSSAGAVGCRGRLGRAPGASRPSLTSRCETGPARRTALPHTRREVGDDVLITARFKEW